MMRREARNIGLFARYGFAALTVSSLGIAIVAAPLVLPFVQNDARSSNSDFALIAPARAAAVAGGTSILPALRTARLGGQSIPIVQGYAFGSFRSSVALPSPVPVGPYAAERGRPFASFALPLFAGDGTPAAGLALRRPGFGVSQVPVPVLVPAAPAKPAPFAPPAPLPLIGAPSPSRAASPSATPQIRDAQAHIAALMQAFASKGPGMALATSPSSSDLTATASGGGVPLPEILSVVRKAMVQKRTMQDAASSASFASPARTAERYRQAPDGVEMDVGIRVNGASVGKLSLWIAGGFDDQTNLPSTNFWMRQGDLLGLFRTRIEPGLYTSLARSRASDDYVSLNMLRGAGISARFDDKDRLVLGDK